MPPRTRPDRAACCPGVTRATNPAVAARLAKAIITLDEEAAADRAAKARAKRLVYAEALPDGMGRVSVEAGREAVTAIIGDLDACVATAKAGGDTRTPDQIRADELVHRMSLGAFGTPAQPVPGRCASAGATAPATTTGTSAGAGGAGTAVGACPCGAGATATGTAGPAGGAGTDGTAGGAGTAAGAADRAGTAGGVSGVRALRVSLTMPLSTWLGLAAEPGVLDGYGPIPAALARQIAAEAARDHPTTTTWRCIPVDDVHRTVLGVGDTIPTPRHDPTPRMRNLATAADPCCVWPNCSRRAVSCDLDHRVPFDHDRPEHGGPTCPCNIAPLCRRHHRLKGTGLIKPVPAEGSRDPRPAADPDAPITEPLGPSTTTPVGSLDWTSWTGRTYRYTPRRRQRRHSMLPNGSPSLWPTITATSTRLPPP